MSARQRNPSSGVFAVALLCVMSACDSIGSELVYVRTLPPGLPELPCQPPPECEPETLIERPLVALPSVDFGLCRRLLDRGCDALDAGVSDAQLRDLDAGFDPSFEPTFDDPQKLPLDECAVPPPYVEPLGEGLPCGPAPTLTCGELVVAGTLNGVQRSRVELNAPVWIGVEVTLTSDHPLEVVLDRAWLHDVSITLRGPVTLRVINSGYVRGLRVRDVEGMSEGAVEFDGVVAADLRLGEPRLPLDRVDVARSELKVSQVIASRVRLESVAMVRARVEAQVMVAIDLRAEDIQLGVDDALIASFDLLLANFTRCDELTLVDGQTLRAQFSPCTLRPARIFVTNVLRGSFDGDLETDRSAWTAVALGGKSNTNITAWSTALASVALCPGVDDLVLADGSTLGCASCPDGVVDSPDHPWRPQEDAGPCTPPWDITGAIPEGLCWIPPEQIPPNYKPVAESYCELPSPPTCEAPHPVRSRPQGAF